MKILNIILLVSIAIGSGIQKLKKDDIQQSIIPEKTNADSMILEARQFVKDGDLVVRLNRDPLSNYIKNFNRREKKYSHAGFLFIEKGQPVVYHIVNGIDSAREYIKRESLADYCNPKENLSFGIFRFDISAKEIKELKTVIKNWQSKKIRFDHQFNLGSDEKMYCSEMISKAIRKATHNRIKTGSTMLTDNEAIVLAGHLHLSNTVLLKKGVIAIDDLYKPSFSRPVKEYHF